MKLTAILATRGRPHLLIPTIEKTLANISRPDTRLVIAVDLDDDQTINARSHKVFSDSRVITASRPREDTLGAKYNNRLSVAPADVYLAMVDYAPHVTPGFDAKIIEAARVFPDGLGVVYNRLANLSFPEINAVTQKWADMAGGLFPEHFPYWFVDHWVDDLARMTGRIAYADVQLDCSRRPGTMEHREPWFWAALYMAMRKERHEIAQSILYSPRNAMPRWQKHQLRESWPLVDGRSDMLNKGVMLMHEGDRSRPDRYVRVKAKYADRVAEWLAANADDPHVRAIVERVLAEKAAQQRVAA